jgi:2-oxoglutarate ferredoxin oxidoreductase subunit alpha
MISDVRLAIDCSRPVEHFGRMGGVVPDSGELVDAMLHIIG